MSVICSHSLLSPSRMELFYQNHFLTPQTERTQTISCVPTLTQAKGLGYAMSTEEELHTVKASPQPCCCYHY